MFNFPQDYEINDHVKNWLEAKYGSEGIVEEEILHF